MRMSLWEKQNVNQEESLLEGETVQDAIYAKGQPTEQQEEEEGEEEGKEEGGEEEGEEE